MSPTSLLPILLLCLSGAGPAPGRAAAKYGTGSWSEKLGNHRAVVRVDAPACAVRVHIPWRRRDAHPERKAVWVTDATDEHIGNVIPVNIRREYGDVVFEPVKCRLAFDFKTLGLDPKKAGLYAPPVDNFQPPALFNTTAPIPVYPKRGWLLVLDETRHVLPHRTTTDPFAARTTLFQDRFAALKLDAAWHVRRSSRPGTDVQVMDNAVHFTATANSVAFVQRAVPAGTAAVTCRVRPETDQGATWGPGLALVWPDGRGLRVNLRAGGQFGVYGYQHEILGGVCFPGETYLLAIELDAQRIRLQASLDGHVWQVLADVPRSAFPGPPSLLRLGKMGVGRHDTDFHIPGPLGNCAISDLQVFAMPRGDAAP